MNHDDLPFFPPDKQHANTCFIIGESRTNADNAITKIYGSFYIAFEISLDTEIVLDFNCTHTLPLTERFLHNMLVGKHFPSIDQWLSDELDRRYGGSSVRAVVTSYRDALKRYRILKEKGGDGKTAF